MNNKFVIGNWKMHGSIATITSLIQGIINNLPKNLFCTCAILPPAIFIPKVYELIQHSKLNLGAQNIYPQDNGAFTGEISGPMLKEFACKYTLVGHSERRHIFNESNTFVAEKFHYAKNSNIIPILCVGETLEEREQGLTEEIITKQLLAVTENSSGSDFQNCIIAYEPVWAIGTGKTATPKQAQEVHGFIRNLIKVKETPILYGGSVNENNAQDLFNTADIDGGLIGGASLEPTKFLQIIAAANTKSNA